MSLSTPEVAARNAAARPADPERVIIVPRLERPGEEPRYLLVQWRDWPPPALLSLDVPSDAAALEPAVVDTLWHRIAVRVVGSVALTPDRQPVRMSKKARGGEGLGWLRAALVRVEGDPQPDPLLEAVLALTLDEALEVLTSDVERALLRRAAALG